MAVFIEQKKYRYYPEIEINGVQNLSLPKSQQISALITRADFETRAELTEMEVVREFSKKSVEAAKEGKEKDEPAEKRKVNFLRRQDTGRILRECVSDIKNVEIERRGLDGKKIETVSITDGSELANCSAFGMDVLIQKFCAEALKDKLAEGDTEKNSEPPSSST